MEHKLSSIDLSHNVDLGDFGGRQFLNSLVGDTLTGSSSLSQIWSQIKEIRLARCGLQSPCAVQLAEMLSRMRSLKLLDVRRRRSNSVPERLRWMLTEC